MEETSIEDADEYIKRFNSDLVEREELIALVTVPETYFFRDKRQFDALTDTVVPKIIAEKKKNSNGAIKPKIKIVSCGCSIGPEPYSIAIACSEAGIRKECDLEIMAFDINKNSVGRAKEAIYSKYSFREPDTDITKHFAQSGNTFALDESIKKMVNIHQMNLFDDRDAKKMLEGVDIVFLRNVLIYFDEPGIETVIGNIAKYISSYGYLFLGSAESLLRRQTAFGMEKIGEVFLWRLREYVQGEKTGSGTTRDYVKDISKKITLPKVSPAPKLPIKKPAAAARVIVSVPEVNRDYTHYDDAMGYWNIKKFGKAEQGFKEQLKVTPKHIESLIGLGMLYADSGRDQLAVSCCEEVIRIDNLVEDVYFILGLVAYKAGNFDKAVINFKKTVYCNENHFVAQYYLGLAYKDSGESDQADRQLQVAVEVIESMGDDGVNTEIAGHTGGYVLSLCVDSVS